MYKFPATTSYMTATEMDADQTTLGCDFASAMSCLPETVLCCADDTLTGIHLSFRDDRSEIWNTPPLRRRHSESSASEGSASESGHSRQASTEGAFDDRFNCDEDIVRFFGLRKKVLRTHWEAESEAGGPTQPDFDQHHLVGVDDGLYADSCDGEWVTKVVTPIPLLTAQHRRTIMAWQMGVNGSADRGSSSQTPPSHTTTRTVSDFATSRIPQTQAETTSHTVSSLLTPRRRLDCSSSRTSPTQGDSFSSWFTPFSPSPRREPTPAEFAQALYNTPPKFSFRLPKWPPVGFTPGSLFTVNEAEQYICHGVLTFTGIVHGISNAPASQQRFFAAAYLQGSLCTDRAKPQSSIFDEASLDVAGAQEGGNPCLTLEYPSMKSCAGANAGTNTLNWWIGTAGSKEAGVTYASNVKPKEIKLMRVMDRLRKLERGIETNPEARISYLYNALIEQPDKNQPHHNMELQMTNLATVLSNTELWTDFSLERNQVLAGFYDSSDDNARKRFFRQLLLAIELFLRIHLPEHTEEARSRLTSQLPPKVAWDVAIAQRWLENMHVSKTRHTNGDITFGLNFMNKKWRVRALRTFTNLLKWPNKDEVGYVLDENDSDEQEVEERSKESMSYFSGVVLPGASLPFLMLNSMFDCDRDTKNKSPHMSHLHPACGFQYRACTYWSHQSIIGKVLGAGRGVKEVCGWIGPCINCPDLRPVEACLVAQDVPSDNKPTPTDVISMARRSHPLGPPINPGDLGYPIDDYQMVLPDPADMTDRVRVQNLRMETALEQPNFGKPVPMTWNASVVFALDNRNITLRLYYDVSFIHAFSCHDGPHPLFYDYCYRAVRVDEELLSITDWPAENRIPTEEAPVMVSTFINNVLVIEAFGVSDNEVFARAWCAQSGVSALVADVRQTCMACAIREAYAACLTVVILTEGGRKGECEEEDDRHHHHGPK
ncbi:hypothetical protein LTR66_001650 [Elasticomyces elasticus]|nr:hypothetical protein LTR66_001650 [Elasticomyces elasticus]